MHQHWSRQQQEIADYKSKRSKSAVAERWKTGAEDSIFNLGEWRILFHLRRKGNGILHSPRMNLPLRQTTNCASPRAHSRTADSEVVWLPLMRKAVGQHRLLDIIPNNLKTGTGQKVWCDWGMSAQFLLGRSLKYNIFEVGTVHSVKLWKSLLALCSSIGEDSCWLLLKGLAIILSF